jgi:predicted transcriptional regulator
MEKYVKTLEKIGLSEKQSLVYLSLVKLGVSDMTDIAHSAGLKRPTVYLIITELQTMGLVSQVVQGKKKLYSPTHPKRITEILASRLKEFEYVYPEIMSLYDTGNTKPVVQMFTGISGVRQAYAEAFSMIQRGVEGLWMGNIGLLIDHHPEIMREYNKTIGQLHIYTLREIIFGGESSRVWVETMNKKLYRQKSKNHSIKYISDNGTAGMTDQFIVGNKIFQFIISNNEVFTTITDSHELAKTARFSFEQIWKSL